ncbi:MAG: hypothetical protein WCE79_17100 [Xanthobacteraceae bacterium]
MSASLRAAVTLPAEIKAPFLQELSVITDELEKIMQNWEEAS